MTGSAAKTQKERNDRLRRLSFAPAVGADYMPRYDLETQVVAALDAGDPVLISGPRRSGKTSLLRRLASLEAAGGSGGDERSMPPVFFDGQVSPAARGLVSALVYAVDPDAKREPAVGPKAAGGRGASLEDALERAIHGIAGRLPRGASLLLLIDEADMPLHHEEEAEGWKRLLKRLAAEPGVRLLASAENGSANDLSEILGRRMRRLEMPAWSRSEIERFLAVLVDTDGDFLLSPESAGRFAKALAPAWPMEVVEVAGAIIDAQAYDPNTKPDDASLEAALMRAAELDVDRLSIAFNRMSRQESQDARSLLVALTAAEGRAVSLEDIEDHGGRPVGQRRAGLAARLLAAAGVLERQNREVATATAVMARAIKSFTGM